MQFPKEAMGPKMGALRDDRRRRFAWIMACGEMSQAEAARQAGYSDVAGGAKVRAHGLMHDPGVVAAIRECAAQVLMGLAPLAITCAKRVLEDSKHPSHARMIETVLDRTGFFAKTEHRVTVEHKVDVAELEALARQLAQESGIDPQRLLGVNSAEEPKVIEGEVVK